MGEELMDEVWRVQERHNDNMITSLEETLRQAEMVCTVIESIRSRLCMRALLLQLTGGVILAAPALTLAWLVISGTLELPGAWAYFGIVMIYLLLCSGCVSFLRAFN